MPEFNDISIYDPVDLITQLCFRKASGDQATLRLLDPDVLMENTTSPEKALSLRSLVKEIFADMGIELAFSGSGNGEKGVVIDVDYGTLSNLGIDDQQIHFGETWVRTQLKPNS